ncbi:MAG: hypothetical protein LBO21_02460 [Synergistaceae bacterium]|nr:hypothetical protein [Synergistaceae bacterium]
MAVLGISEKERLLTFNSIDLLPDLEEEVFFDDIVIPDLVESYECGMDDWWGDFIAGSNL